MTIMDHWLYGKDKRKVKINKETDCRKCIHLKICSVKFDPKFMELICSNYYFGNSNDGCGGCLHRFTRYDKENVPCFICKYFEEKK